MERRPGALDSPLAASMRPPSVEVPLTGGTAATQTSAPDSAPALCGGRWDVGASRQGAPPPPKADAATVEGLRLEMARLTAALASERGRTNELVGLLHSALGDGAAPAEPPPP